MLARISKPKVEPYFLITFSTIHTHTHVNQSIPSINPFKRRFSLALIIDHVVQRTERPWHCVTTCLHRKHSIRALFTHTYRQIKHYATLKITSVSHERQAANGSYHYRYQGVQHVRGHDDLPPTNVNLCLTSEFARFVTLTHPTDASVLSHATHSTTSPIPPSSLLHPYTSINDITSGSAAWHRNELVLAWKHKPDTTSYLWLLKRQSTLASKRLCPR